MIGDRNVADTVWPVPAKSDGQEGLEKAQPSTPQWKGRGVKKEDTPLAENSSVVPRPGSSKVPDAPLLEAESELPKTRLVKSEPTSKKAASDFDQSKHARAIALMAHQVARSSPIRTPYNREIEMGADKRQLKLIAKEIASQAAKEKARLGKVPSAKELLELPKFGATQNPVTKLLGVTYVPREILKEQMLPIGTLTLDGVNACYRKDDLISTLYVLIAQMGEDDPVRDKLLEGLKEIKKCDPFVEMSQVKAIFSKWEVKELKVAGFALKKPQESKALPVVTRDLEHILQTLTPYVSSAEVLKVNASHSKSAVSVLEKAARISGLVESGFAFKLGPENTRELAAGKFLTTLGLQYRVVPKLEVQIEQAMLSGIAHPEGIASRWLDGAPLPLKEMRDYAACKAKLLQARFRAAGDTSENLIDLLDSENGIWTRLADLELQNSHMVEERKKINQALVSAQRTMFKYANQKRPSQSDKEKILESQKEVLRWEKQVDECEQKIAANNLALFHLTEKRETVCAKISEHSADGAQNIILRDTYRATEKSRQLLEVERQKLQTALDLLLKQIEQISPKKFSCFNRQAGQRKQREAREEKDILEKQLAAKDLALFEKDKTLLQIKNSLNAALDEMRTRPLKILGELQLAFEQSKAKLMEKDGTLPYFNKSTSLELKMGETDQLALQISQSVVESIHQLEDADALCCSYDSHAAQFIQQADGLYSIDFARYFAPHEAVVTPTATFATFRSCLLDHPVADLPLSDEEIAQSLNYDMHKIESEWQAAGILGNAQEFDEAARQISSLKALRDLAGTNSREANLQLAVDFKMNLESSLTDERLQRRVAAFFVKKIEKWQSACFRQIHPKAFLRLKMRIDARQNYLRAQLAAGRPATRKEAMHAEYPTLSPFIKVLERLTGSPFEDLGISVAKGKAELRSLESIIGEAERHSMATPEELKEMREALAQIRREGCSNAELSTTMAFRAA